MALTISSIISAALKLRAPQLKEKFYVFGDYYDFVVGNRTYPCRVTLELIEKQRWDNAPDVYNLSPDLLVVMLNPGSSRPLDSSYSPDVITNISDLCHRSNWVEAMPDTTQYQIMRLMQACGFKHARILNLSDLRTPKSAVLLEEVVNLSRTGAQWHSIFSELRQGELEYRLPESQTVPVVLGWGRFAAMRPWALECLKLLDGRKCYGISVGESQDELIYAHPSPMLQSRKEEWLMTVIQQVLEERED